MNWSRPLSWRNHPTVQDAAIEEEHQHALEEKPEKGRQVKKEGIEIPAKPVVHGEGDHEDRAVGAVSREGALGGGVGEKQRDVPNVP